MKLERWNIERAMKKRHLILEIDSLAFYGFDWIFDFFFEIEITFSWIELLSLIFGQQLCWKRKHVAIKLMLVWLLINNWLHDYFYC